MKRTFLFTFAVAACVAAGGAFAGPTDKVTGESTYAGCNGCVPGDELGITRHRLISAHEAFGRRAQKGFYFAWNDEGRWFDIDFRDTHNTCVNVISDSEARIGGLVGEGNGPQVGRYFGIYIVDAGEPAWFADHGFTYRVSLDYGSEEARLGLLNWCETGELAGLYGGAVWPHVVIDGNVQVHNSPMDGD
jgi:hypothetical protein